MLLLDDVRENLHNGQKELSKGEDQISFLPNARRDRFILEVFEEFSKTTRGDRHGMIMAMVLYEAGFISGLAAHKASMQSDVLVMIDKLEGALKATEGGAA